MDRQFLERGVKFDPTYLSLEIFKLIGVFSSDTDFNKMWKGGNTTLVVLENGNKYHAYEIENCGVCFDYQKWLVYRPGCYGYHAQPVYALYLPDSVKFVTDCSHGFPYLEHLRLSENLVEVGDSFGCGSKLKELVLPSSLNKVGHSFFEESQLEKLVINGPLTIKGDFCVDSKKLHTVVGIEKVVSPGRKFLGGCTLIDFIPYGREGPTPLEQMIKNIKNAREAEYILSGCKWTGDGHRRVMVGGVTECNGWFGGPQGAMTVETSPEVREVNYMFLPSGFSDKARNESINTLIFGAFKDLGHISSIRTEKRNVAVTIIKFTNGYIEYTGDGSFNLTTGIIRSDGAITCEVYDIYMYIS